MNMKRSTQNKLALGLLILIGGAGFFIGTVQPRISTLTDISVSGINESKVDGELFDLYLADYSECEKFDDGTKQLTLEILYKISNPYTDRKIIVPQLSVDIYHINKPVGRLWTVEDFVLESYEDKNSNTAGLLPIFFSLYIGGENSGLNEFINRIMASDFGGLRFNVSIYMGDLPIELDILLGQILADFGFGESAGGELDISVALTDMLGGDLGGVEMAIRENCQFLRNDSSAQDVRALVNDESVPILQHENMSLYFGGASKFSTITLLNATGDNVAAGDGTYTWEYYTGTSWIPLDIIDTTSNFKQDGEIQFTIQNDWNVMDNGLVSFFPEEFYYVRCTPETMDSGIDEDRDEYIRLNIAQSTIGTYPLQEEKVNEFPEKELPEGCDGLTENEIPDEIGIIRAGEDFDTFLNDRGVNLEEFMAKYILGEGMSMPTGLDHGFDVIEKKDWITKLPEDSFASDNVSRIFLTMFSFLFSHNVDMGEFIIGCEILWEDALTYLATNFNGYTVDENGLDSVSGLDIYSQSLTIERNNRTIRNSIILVFFLLASYIIGSVMVMRKNHIHVTEKDFSNIDKAPTKNSINKNEYKTIPIVPQEAIKNDKNWELIGALMGMLLGIGLYYLKIFAFPDFSDENIYNATPEGISDILSQLNNTSDSNPYFPLTIMFISFLDFPSCFAWIIPALFVSYKRNTQFDNVQRNRSGLKVLWHAAYLIELTFAIFTIGIFIGWISGAVSFMSYMSGGWLLILSIFISPYFWISIGLVIIFDLLGVKFGSKKEGKYEITFKTVPINSEETMTESDAKEDSLNDDILNQIEQIEQTQKIEDTDETESSTRL